jgi:hypothetical protein
MGFNLGFKGLIVPVVLYGCETWLLILREEHRLKDKIIVEWRKLHN